jgi:hypothetical protein
VSLAAEVAIEASDLSAFLGAAGADLPAEVAIEAGATLARIRNELARLAGRIAAAGPG